MINSNQSAAKIKIYDNSLTGLSGVVDTMSYAHNTAYTTNFGFFGQDVMVQWFEAPADLDILAVSFFCTDDENSAVSVKLVKMAWDKDQLLATGNEFGATWWGYYEADQNGYNDIAPFQDDGDVTGGWIEASTTAQEKGWGSPFSEDLWIEFGFGHPIEAVNGQETWVDMSLLGLQPSVKSGDIFAVVVKNDGTTMDAGRTGFAAHNNLGFHGFKFYRNGRLQTGVDFGWWTRLYTWDFRVAVNITGDRPPEIELHTPIIATSLVQDPRHVGATISDDNPSGGGAGVASAQINVRVNESSSLIVAPMHLTNGDSLNGDWTGEIPGNIPGTAVSWFVSAIDVNGNRSESLENSYKIFKQEFPTLLVMNGLGDSGYPTDFYFGHPTPYPYDHDTWAFGALTSELADYYCTIIEISTGGPMVINNTVIRQWLEKADHRNYMLAGDEWLGAQTNWVDQDWGPGSFHYDILGITHEYNDIVGENNGKSQVFTVPGSLLGDALDKLSKTVVIDSATIGVDTLWYDPKFEVNMTNWLDGVDVREDCDVFIKGLGADGEIYNIGHSRRLPAGNKIAFFAYDPISINSTPYIWFGWDQVSPQNIALRSWMDNVHGCYWYYVSIEQNQKSSLKFQLNQNYPNPFNPVTIIKYELANTSSVKLTVYDLLGREVKTLVNKNQTAGKHQVSFDASDLATGIYVYKLTTTQFSETRKMLLLR